MRVVLRIRQLVGRADWVPEPDRLIKGTGDEELGLLQVANIDDRVVMRHELLVERHNPRRLHAKQFYHISLQIPNENLALLIEVVVPARVFFVRTSVLLLSDRVWRNVRIVCLR